MSGASKEPKEKSRFRKPKGILGLWQDFLLIILPVTGIVCILNVPSYLGFAFYIQQYLAIFFGLLMAVLFMLVPFRKGAPADRLPWYDLIFSLLSLVSGIYLAVYYKEIVNELGLIVPHRTVLATITILLILEASRRLLGWIFTFVVLFFLFYALFAFLFPGGLYGRGTSWARLSNFLYLDPQGILGIAIETSAVIVFPFVFFGQALYNTGGGEFFTDSAMALMGKYRGGPAKVSILASSLFGTISGSAVANVVTTGSVTIPLMKRTGYPPHFAAAVEATASSGGLIMPPVMGAAAFLMATFLAVPYSSVVISAIVPALLYYIGVYIQVDLEAAKSGLQGIPRNELPVLSKVIRKGWLFFIPISILLYTLLILMLDVDKAGLYTVTSVFIIGFVRKENRLNFRKVVQVFKQTGEGMLEIGVICAAAGIIIGVVSFTGLGFTFSRTLVGLSGGSTLILLMLAAIGAIILGMGMTVTAAYLLMVILIAPALIELGMAPLGAHLFVFYFAVMSFLTPPICLAVFAAAGLAGASMMKTAFQAIKLGIAAYIVPFLFAYHPSLLLQGDVARIIHSIVTAVIGIGLLGIGAEGFLFRKLHFVKRILLVAGGMGCMIPGWTSDLIGLGIGIPICVWEWMQRRREKGKG
jgi:TRAP transporter 4TM/12TM fusion protein